jgi:hypothetical protein
MAKVSDFLNIANHQPPLLKPMNSDAKLSQSPIHKGTREYVDSKFMEMEQRIEQKLAVMRAAQTSIKQLIAQVDTKLHADLNSCADKVAGLSSQLANFETTFAASSARLIEPRPRADQRAHGESEIRELINTHGHKIRPRSRFSAYQYAEDLAEFVMLRPADKVFRDGEPRWNRSVSSAISHWLRLGGLGSYRGECPFEKTGKNDYRIKEGWQWPAQAS